MAQFDIYRNTNQATAALFPYLVDVQHPILASLHTRMVVPLGVGIEPIRHLNPVFHIEGRQVVMATAEMAGVPLSVLGEKVDSLYAHRQEIFDALDFLVHGF